MYLRASLWLLLATFVLVGIAAQYLLKWNTWDWTAGVCSGAICFAVYLRAFLVRLK